MTNTHTITVDACTMQLRPLNVNLLNYAASNTRGNTILELINWDNEYRINFAVHVRQHYVGILSLQHFKAVVDRDLYAFKYDNAILYTDHVALITEFLSDFELVQNNVSSLEIAIDTNRNVCRDFMRYFDQPESYNYHYSPTTLEQLKVVGKKYRDGSENLTLCPFIANDKRLKLYNKTLDIAEKGKAYITDYHALNGIDTTKPVYRVELTLTNTAFKTKETIYRKGNEQLSAYDYKKLPELSKVGYVEDTIRYDTTPAYSELRDPVVLLALFNKYTNRFKAFSLKDNDRKSRCTPISLLKLSVVNEPIANSYTVTKKEYKIQMTATFKTLIRQYYTTSNSQYLTTAQQLAKDSHNEDELSKQLKALAPLRQLYATAAIATANELLFS